MRQTKNSFTIYFSSANEGIHLLYLITGILELKYDPEPERTFWKRRRAQRLAKSNNLDTEEEHTTKAMGDEPNGRDYCGKVNIKQEPEWSPPSNHSSEGIFWDDLADTELESQEG
ncbi:hypothetical protein P8452_71247 [Trifolium repens]|nr:hypothetical protein P8452_71247 [Trifolium repens]